MGLSSLPTPSEGMLTLFLVKTALSVSILKEVLRSALHLLRLRSPSPPPPPSAESSSSPDSLPGESLEPTITDRFRTHFKPFWFGSGKRSAVDGSTVDCRVCLLRFEPESIVNRLPCGHLFHKPCLETWLDYHHATCPLCRSHLL